jgi:hypothetical protein
LELPTGSYIFSFKDKKVIETKKFTIYQFISFMLISIMLIFLNIKYDTYGVFSDKIIPYPIFDIINLRINKFNYLEKNYNQYDSYLIGGSRALVYRETDLNRYTNNNFYNYAGIRSDIYDSLIAIRYLLKRQQVKMIIIQIGVDDLYLYSENNENLLQRSHYKLIEENRYIYYFKYIFSFDLIKTVSNYISLKFLNINKINTSPDEFYLYTKFEELIKEDPSKFFNGQFSKNLYIKLPEYKKNKIKQNIEALREIKKLTEESNTQLIIITAPLNHFMYHKIKKEDLELYLNQIKEITPFWNFTTLNSITLDNTNYYDYSHLELR